MLAESVDPAPLECQTRADFYRIRESSPVVPDWAGTGLHAGLGGIKSSLGAAYEASARCRAHPHPHAVARRLARCDQPVAVLAQQANGHPTMFLLNRTRKGAVTAAIEPRGLDIPNTIPATPLGRSVTGCESMQRDCCGYCTLFKIDCACHALPRVDQSA